MKASRLIEGVILVYALYYAGYGWLPASIVRDRVLKYIVNYYPFLGSPGIDLLVLVASLSILMATAVEKRMYYIGSAAIAIAGYLAHGVWQQSLTLYSAAALLALYPAYKSRGLLGLVRQAVPFLVLTEATAIAAACSYFATGSWSEASWAIIARERMLWAPLEWASIPLLASMGLLWLARLLRGSRQSSRRGGSRGCRGSYCLALAMTLSAMVVVVPHLPTVDPGLQPISVDTYYYLRFIRDAEEHGLTWALKAARGFARPVYLLLIYALSRLVDPIVLMDVVHPAASIMLLSLSSYILARRIYGCRAACIATILAPLGHSAVTFIAGGFQANSLAMPIAMLMLAINPSRPSILLLTGLAVALIHPWTMIMYSAGYILYYAKAGSGLKQALRALVVLLTALALSEAIDRLLASSPLEATTRTLQAAPGLYFPVSLFRGVEYWTWGSQANALVYTMASLGPATSIVAALVAVSTPLLLASSSMIVHRLILNMPLEVQAAGVAAEIDKQLTVLLFLASLARSLEVLSGMTPLTGELWRAILYRP
ncbi:MAG: hypothetical protein ABWW69_07885 [Pyrodictiaceae archaeon]